MDKVLITDKVLYEQGQALIRAAYQYWTHYNEVNETNAAVVHLTTETGAMILFTRSEYKQTLMANIDNIADEKYFDPALFLKIDDSTD